MQGRQERRDKIYYPQIKTVLVWCERKTNDDVDAERLCSRTVDLGTLRMKLRNIIAHDSVDPLVKAPGPLIDSFAGFNHYIKAIYKLISRTTKDKDLT